MAGAQPHLYSCQRRTDERDLGTQEQDPAGKTSRNVGTPSPITLPLGWAPGGRTLDLGGSLHQPRAGKGMSVG
jgi:hypothetical protein